jgi:PAS domain S-box-containing protein
MLFRFNPRGGNGPYWARSSYGAVIALILALFVAVTGFDTWETWDRRSRQIEQLAGWLTGAPEHLVAAIGLGLLMAVLAGHLVRHLRSLTHAEQAAAATAIEVGSVAERYRLLLESNVTGGIYLLDPAGGVESWNAAAERIKGYTPGEIIGRNFAVFFTPEDVADGEPERELAVTRDTGHFEAEATRVRKDGSHFLARVLLDAIRRDDGTLRGFAMVTYDITNLRIEEEQRKIIIEAAPNGMMIVDEAGVITLVNSAAERIFDYPAGALVGQKVEIVVPEGIRDPHNLLWSTGRVDTAMAPPRQLTGKKRDGAAVSIEIMLNAIRTPRGRIVVASLMDVTQRFRQAAEQNQAEQLERDAGAATNAQLERLARHLAEARDKAEEANKAKSRFLTSITHELRTPLHGILGYAELLSLEGGLNPVQTERVAAMMAAGEHLLGMINSVLDVSQIEADRLELHPEEIESLNFIGICLDLVRPAAEAKGLVLISSGVAPLRLFADPTRLRQVLINLLGNAIKFTPSGSIEVRLGPAETEGFIRLEVADTGPGIWAGHRGKLFQKFERLNAKALAEIEGSGLGLALSAQLARLSGGRIGYADNPGGGSIFWIELPMGDAGRHTATAAAIESVAARPVRRVLVVDDEALNRAIASGFLKYGGHEVICIDNGAEAVERAAVEHFDAILMDVRMPGMNGLEATRRIRALPSPYGIVPVVAVTAQAFAQQIEICRQAGMETHLSKPFTKEGLLAAVENAILMTGSGLNAAISNATVAPEIPEFDRDAFEDTTALLPSEDIGEHLGTLISRAEALSRQLRAPGILMRAGELADAAHALGGAASFLGFKILAEVTRNFEYAVDSGAPDTEVLGALLIAATEEAIPIMRRELATMTAVAA